MNREQKLTRLQSLLEKVQTRARERREPYGAAAVAFAVEPDASPRRPAVPRATLGFDIAPVSMPTAEPFDSDETRPFTHRPSVPSPNMAARSSSPNVPAVLPMREPEASPPASARRAVALKDHAPAIGVDVVDERDQETVKERTPFGPPAPQRQPSAVQLEVDTARTGLGAEAPGAGPTLEQLGQTVEFDEEPKGAVATFELDERPVAKKVELPPAEMEAELPAASAPGAYSPALERASQTTLDADATLHDWDLPESIREAAAKAATVAQKAVPTADKPAEAAPVAQKAVPTADKPAEVAPVAGPVPAAPAEPKQPLQPPPTVELVPEAGAAPFELKPVVVRVEATITRASVVAASDIAAFRGAVEGFQPKTFLELLDATLALGSAD